MVGTEYEGKPKMVQNGFDKDWSRVGTQDRNFQFILWTNRISDWSSVDLKNFEFRENKLLMRIYYRLIVLEK